MGQTLTSSSSTTTTGQAEQASTRRSRERLVAAVTALVDERDPSEVSVTDVVRRAGLTRPTFYSSFADLPTALVAAAMARLEEAFAAAPPAQEARQADAGQLRAVLTEVLTRMVPHARFFTRALKGPGGLEAHTAIIGYLAQRLATSSPATDALARGPLPPQVSTEAVAAGLTWTMLRWLEDPPQRSINDMAALLCDLVLLMTSPGLGGGPEGGPGAPAARGGDCSC